MSDLAHHRDLNLPCEGCDARWAVDSESGNTLTMKHRDNCPIYWEPITVPNTGCHFCGTGDAVELAADYGHTVGDKSFHTECVLDWGRSQGFTQSELDVLAEQAFG